MEIKALLKSLALLGLTAPSIGVASLGEELQSYFSQFAGSTNDGMDPSPLLNGVVMRQNGNCFNQLTSERGSKYEY